MKIQLIILAMKLAFILLFAASCFGQTIQERVKKFENAKNYAVKYDKFQKHTEIETTVYLTTKGKGFFAKSFLTLYPSLFIGDSGDVTVTLLASGGSSSFHNRPTMRFLLDGQSAELESNDMDDTVGFIMPVPFLERIANAKIVEVQLGTFEGKFDAKALTAFKNLHSLTIAPLPPR
jgi:hypothetical protein